MSQTLERKILPAMQETWVRSLGWVDPLEKGMAFHSSIQNTKIMASGPITSWQIDGEIVETVSDFILGGPKSLQMVIAAMKLKDTFSLEGNL